MLSVCSLLSCYIRGLLSAACFLHMIQAPAGRELKLLLIFSISRQAPVASPEPSSCVDDRTLEGQ